MRTYILSPLKRGGEDLLLDIERRGVDDEVGPVLLILAAPYELRIEVAVPALVGYAHRILLVLLHHRLIFGGGDVLPRGLVVGQGFYGPLLRLLRHGFILCPSVLLDAFEAFMRRLSS